MIMQNDTAKPSIQLLEHDYNLLQSERLKEFLLINSAETVFDLDESKTEFALIQVGEDIIYEIDHEKSEIVLKRIKQ